MQLSEDMSFISISMFNWQIENQGLFFYHVYIAFNEVFSSHTPSFKCELFYYNEREVCKILETGGYISWFLAYFIMNHGSKDL